MCYHMYMQMFIFHKNIQNEIPTEEQIKIWNGTGTIELVLKILYQFFYISYSRMYVRRKGNFDFERNRNTHGTTYKTKRRKLSFEKLYIAVRTKYCVPIFKNNLYQRKHCN